MDSFEKNIVISVELYYTIKAFEMSYNKLDIESTLMMFIESFCDRELERRMKNETNV